MNEQLAKTVYRVLGSWIHAHANTFLGLKPLAHFDMRTALSLGVGGKSFACAATPGVWCQFAGLGGAIVQ